MVLVGDPMIIIPICRASSPAGSASRSCSSCGRRLRFGTGRVRLSAHIRLTVYGSLILLAIGTVGFAFFEWSNPGTLRAMPARRQAVGGSRRREVFPRTTGFNSVDCGLVSEPTRA